MLKVVGKLTWIQDLRAIAHDGHPHEGNRAHFDPRFDSEAGALRPPTQKRNKKK
jgi:hypothetical protein